MRPIDEAAFRIGAVLFGSGLGHVVFLLIGGGSWEGPVSLRKAATFGLSFGLTLINVTYVASFISMRDRSRNLLLGPFAAACVLETALVSMQAWRGVPSHFNMETGFDSAVATTLAIGGFVLVPVIVALTVAAFRDRTALPPSLRLAIKSGLVGGVPQAAYATGGWLKPVHGVLMHGILVLPLLAWATAAANWNEPEQVRTVRAGVAVYTLVVVAAMLVSLSKIGIGPF